MKGRARGGALGLAAVLALAPATRSLAGQCTEPGKARWSIKSSLTPAADTMTPRELPLERLLHLPDPAGVTKNDARYQRARIPEAVDSTGLREGDVVTTVGWLHLVATEDNDCEYHIQLSVSPTDGDHCLIVEIPKDDSVSIASPALRQLAGAARAFIRDQLLAGREPGQHGNVMRHEVYVRVTGQLFYDDAHIGDQPRGKRGMHAATLWEIHPVTVMAFAPHPAAPGN